MRVYVIGSSALYYWRHAAHGKDVLDSLAYGTLTDCPSSAQELKRIAVSPRQFGSLPIHLMVSNGSHRFLRSVYTYSVESGELPDGAFRKVNDQVNIASPELCLVHASKVLSIPRLLELCMELCGTYALASETTRGFFTRSCPLMTLDSLKKFLNRYGSYSVNRRIAPWLKYVAQGSHSPMETREYLLMCLPKRLGGYGLPSALLNYPIKLSNTERQLARRSYFLCDMYWPEQKIVVEHDGQEDHASITARAESATRQNILVNKGHTVFVITAKQIFSTDEFESIVKNIARHMHFRLKNYPGDWDSRHAQLRDELFKSAELKQAH